MSILQKLTEGVVNRDMRKEGAALLDKWEKTGLLEGLDNDTARNGMARLLENQAKQLLKEAASTMAGGNVEGFAAVAFPIVRRVFGGLIANELVSVQPMSLPSGLIFFLDFTFGGPGAGSGDPDSRAGMVTTTSLYGGNKVGAEITGGVNLGATSDTDTWASDAGGSQFYDLLNGYSSPTGTLTGDNGDLGPTGTIGANGKIDRTESKFTGQDNGGWNGDEIDARILQYDIDLPSGSAFAVIDFQEGDINDAGGNNFNYANMVSFTLRSGCTEDPLNDVRVIQRLNRNSGSSDGSSVQHNGDVSLLAVALTGTAAILAEIVVQADATYEFSIKDAYAANTGLTKVGSVVGEDFWGLENNTDIPEINLKVDSVSVTANTKKLKAKWTPELGQDLNAYHNLDAEVELTSLLSEQIALEIDREIVNDLVKDATAATYYWSRSPGLFVNKKTGTEVGASSAAPDFTGTVSEWYETLGETINDVSAQIHRKTLRGGANFLVTSPEVANILEFTAGFRANVTHDDSKGTAGTDKVGTLSKRYDVYVDPYFPRNLVLIGRRGNSFLESGYVYAPYVPLQVTPTIFGVEDFVPRKGVMTRYAKRMVRPDMYGLVVVRGLLGEAGATA